MEGVRLRHKVVGIVAQPSVSFLIMPRYYPNARQLAHYKIRGPEVLDLVPGLQPAGEELGISVCETGRTVIIRYP
jgi:hypothetical protein